MTTVHPAPPLDPDAGAVWRNLLENVFGGAMPTLTDEPLTLLRSFELSNRDSLLADRAYTERSITFPVPDSNLTLSVFTPDGHMGNDPGLFWIHGGGMVSGTRWVANTALDTVGACGAVVISIDYRFAPEDPAPGPLDDCYAGLRWCADHASELGIDPARLVLGGASAGGGLAAATALRVRD